MQRAAQSSTKPLRRAIRLVQTADMSAPQLLSPLPNEVVCVQISLAVSDEGDKLKVCQRGPI